MRCKEEWELTLFRVIQELVNNTLKHAKAKKMKIAINTEVNKLLIEVMDDGIGFEEKEVKEKKDVGIGLISLSQRIEALGGRLIIKSKKLKGTTISISVPI